MATANSKGVAVHVWSMDISAMRIWTKNEVVYASVDGVEYVEATSAKGPPSFLSMLVYVFENELAGTAAVAGIDSVHVAVATVAKLNRSSSRVKITFEATWTCDEMSYDDPELCACFIAVPL